MPDPDSPAGVRGSADPTPVVPGSAGEVAAPGSAGEVAELLRSTTGTVVPVGAGTKTGWAAPATSCDLLLRTTGLDRVTEYAPGDLVVVAEAGVPLAALQEQLATHGQMLALDPPEQGATLGGILAANASGPRRLRYGTVRDLLIGVTVVLADGTVARSGGKVVKNVAGYDLGKLHTGAHGGLGIVVSTTWRLHPRPPAAATVTAPVRGSAAAGRLTARVARSTLTPTALELRWQRGESGTTGELVALFESIPASVRDQAPRCAALLAEEDAGRGSEAADPEARTTRGDEAVRIGAAPPAWFGERPVGQLVLRLAFAPSALPYVLDALPPGSRGTASAAVGVAYAAVPPAIDLAALRAALARWDGSAVVLAADPELRPGLDHWGPTGDAFGLMTRVKDRFDPERRLSPGRLLGGL
ncbi:glycolate oxidase FAD binding subunit [Actinacidiphila yanglinensis]|uniref:Glycolate oxidase FAD binding subunit n=1 Tax=Actinacidiphila yanglinensis TaxID=310779 RepID=A0A1H5YTP6_9ACTN|nr:FAD-binding oxidoreductase [Actinacidiphila yanglinensis]SEG27364.1 glycolate oxidase FAD binding subunit [Actinacidiphila yanglinensis]